MIFDQWNIFGQAVHLKKNWSISQILFAVKTQVYFVFFLLRVYKKQKKSSTAMHMFLI